MASLASSSTADIVKKIEVLLETSKTLKDGDDYARVQLMQQVELLYEALEPPVNNLTQFYCINIAVSLGIFDHMKDEGSTTADELGHLTHASTDVIARVMRVLVASRVVASMGEDSTMLNVSYITLPEFFKTRSPDELVDIRKTPYACAYGMEGKTFYEVLSAKPDHLYTFNKSMSEPGPEWGMFPFASLREEVEAEPERPFVVDIGGGKGQALLRIRDETCNAFGTSSKLILQERPDVLEQIQQEDIAGIEKMPYDFHTPQPVQGGPPGAHVYFFSQIIHNYPDHVCQDILARAAKAMSLKSRLLIVESVLPATTDVGGDMGAYLVDFVGLAMGGKERTEKEFKVLLASAGLVLTKVWPGKARHQAIIEARLQRE
ncbi:hypothetical protein NQ176_g1079 [Zarea fungicola]|uniref:Uncharacterized protein n=1 Tax=Zarea fungicola TaxID=93591 RepID=A0ACC1NVL4_9HYPO|nr:hypothetical protein NQ176_g1079 [Lecanicillium fungicola]